MKRLLALVLLVSVTGCPPATNPSAPAPVATADDGVAVNPPQARVVHTPEGSGALATRTREAFGQLGMAAVRSDMDRVQAMILAGQAHHLKEGTEFLVLRHDDLCSYGEVRSGPAAGMRLWVMSESLAEPTKPTVAPAPAPPPARGSPPKAVAKANQPKPEPQPGPETVRPPKSAAGKVSGYWYASSLFRFMSREESAMRQQHGGKLVEISNGTCPLILLRATTDSAGHPVAFFGCGEFVDPEDGTDYSAWRIRATFSPRGERTLAGLRLTPVTVPFVRGILGGRTGTIIDMTECELQTPEERAQEGRDEAKRVRQVHQPISKKEAAAAKQRQTEAEAAARRAEAESPQGREETAARELRLTRKVIEDAKAERQVGNPHDAEKMLGRATDRLRQIIKQYPETKAAKQAGALLEELN